MGEAWCRVVALNALLVVALLVVACGDTPSSPAPVPVPVPVSPCATANGGCAQRCEDVDAGAACSCEAGYVLGADGRACDDVDECLTANGGCAADATCANTVGARTCACPRGEVGDGVTCAWEAPLSPSSLPPLQIGLSGDASRSWLFADVLRGAEVWVLPQWGTPAYDSAQADALAATLEVDERGWPRALPDHVGITISQSYATGEHTYLHGVYVLTWDGTGTVALEPSTNDGVGGQLLLTSPNRIVLNMDTVSEYPIVRVSSMDPLDPVRNLHLWAPAFDGAGVTLDATADLSPGHVMGSLEPAPGAPLPLFHPAFLAHLAEMPDGGVLRFLAWLDVNGITDETPMSWADRSRADQLGRSLSIIDVGWSRHHVRAFGGRLGYPYEWLVALCNETGRDLWVQVPHTATPDLVRGLARMIATELRPDLRVWAEYSNEQWNGSSAYLPQQLQARARAAEHFGIAPEAVSFTQLAWGAGQLQAGFLETFEEEWRLAGQSDARLVNVAAGFAVSADYNRALLASMQELAPTSAEVLAISNYFGHGAHTELFAAHPFGSSPGVWPAALDDAAAGIVRRELHDTYADWVRGATVARDAGVPMIAYEGGQHLLPVGLGDWSNPAHVDFMGYMRWFQRTPQMRALYREQLALWSAAGGRTPSVFTDLGAWSFFGYWGAKEFVTETRAQSAKWDAACTYGERLRGARDASEPLGTRPVFAALPTLHAEAGLPLDVALTTTDGEGTVEVSLLGGELPPGLSLVAEGAGVGRLSGTPAAPGTFWLVVQARDVDGDVDTMRVELTVDPEGVSGHALVVFRGAELPVSLEGTGRYDPVRGNVSVDGGNALCVPFSLDEALFHTEYNHGAGLLEPTSALTAYGGWCVTAQPSAARTGPPEESSWTGLRSGRFEAWTGDVTGPTTLDLSLLWRSEQFAPFDGAGPYAFGADAATSTLQVDLESLSTDGSNELRFVVVDHVGAEDRWYLSEAAWTRRNLGDGVFRLDRFSGTEEPGRRWAVITAPAGTTIALPTTGLAFAGHAFDDVRAVGIFYRGGRGQWHYLYAFNRFLALGERR